MNPAQKIWILLSRKQAAERIKFKILTDINKKGKGSKRSKYTMHSPKTKENAVKLAEIIGINRAAEQLNLSRKSLKRWIDVGTLVILNSLLKLEKIKEEEEKQKTLWWKLGSEIGSQRC